MNFDRTCGVLLHPTSLPSAFGMGDFGPSAYAVVDFLEQTGQCLWQVLPLTPTGYGDSPYASYSAFAGNIYLISPEKLLDEGLLTQQELDSQKEAENTRLDYSAAYAKKHYLLKLAANRFYSRQEANDMQELESFKQENSYWLQDYVEFVAAFEANGKKPWTAWEDRDMANFNKKGRTKINKQLGEEVAFHSWAQFTFFKQWNALRAYASQKQVKLVGDIPIFVDHNSADVWSNRKYFQLKKDGTRDKVAGVPPDFFSATGQLWGNPQYNWKKLKADGYSWWIERFKQMFRMYDIVRVDHFRGFEAYWEVDASEKTAENGRWVKGPGFDLFDTVMQELDDAPIIAEDLGVITKEVVALRTKYGFPGMRILQFGWSSDSANSFLPHNYDQNTVCYTGTHDNDTTLGWYQKAPEKEKHEARIYTRTDGTTINWEFIRLCFLSSADMAIIPMQDYMNLDGEHRMNLPGTTVNNWQWRYNSQQFDAIDRGYIKHLCHLSNRDPRLGLTDENLQELEVEEA